jgi:hypothetical protein
LGTEEGAPEQVVPVSHRAYSHPPSLFIFFCVGLTRLASVG